MSLAFFAIPAGKLKAVVLTVVRESKKTSVTLITEIVRNVYFTHYSPPHTVTSGTLKEVHMEPHRMQPLMIVLVHLAAFGLVSLGLVSLTVMMAWAGRSFF
jgi:hypothetical protein